MANGWGRGLLDEMDRGVKGFDGLLFPSTVPEGAGYSVADQKLARMAMLGSAGATLLAAAQPGQIGDRGRHLAGLAQVPMAGAQMLQQSAQQQSAREYQQAQIAALRAKQQGGADLARLLGGGPALAQPVAMTQNLGGAEGGPPTAGGYYGMNRRDESRGDPAARNPRSSATGADQFVEATWLDFARANPDAFAGMSRAQILAKRTDPDLSLRATQWLAQNNAPQLERAGLPVHDGTVRLAHRFGAGGAAALLKAAPDTPVERLLSPKAMEQNPELAGRTAGQVVAPILQRYGTGNSWREAPGAGGGASTQPPASAGARTPGYNGNTLANMPAELRAMAATRAAAGDIDGATQIVTQWMTAPPRTVQTAQVGGRVREMTPSGELGRDYGSSTPQRRPMTAEDRALWPNLDPRKEYAIGEDGVPHPIEAGGTNVTIQTDNAAREAAIRRINTARETSDPVMSSAVPQAVIMREQLMAGLQTGRIDEATLSARQLLQSIGLLTPEQAQNADSQTLFRAMSSSMIPRMRAAGSGSSSDLDVRMFSQAAPNLATSPQGNLTIASTFIQQAEHEQARVGAMEEYLQAHGNLVGFDRHWRQNGPPLFPRVATPEEAMTGHAPGTVVILPPEAKGQVSTFPFYVVPVRPPAPPQAPAP